MWKLKCAVAVTAAITRRIQIDTQAKMFEGEKKDGILMQLVSFHAAEPQLCGFCSLYNENGSNAKITTRDLGITKQPSVIPIDFNS